MYTIEITVKESLISEPVIKRIQFPSLYPALLRARTEIEAFIGTNNLFMLQVVSHSDASSGKMVHYRYKNFKGDF